MVKNIVLVHGGLVDGSSWAKVIPLLEAQGLEVTAVQNPLTGLVDDVAATPALWRCKTAHFLAAGRRGGLHYGSGPASWVGAPNVGQWGASNF